MDLKKVIQTIKEIGFLETKNQISKPVMQKQIQKPVQTNAQSNIVSKEQIQKPVQMQVQKQGIQNSVEKEPELIQTIPRGSCEVISSFEQFCSLFPKLIAKENNSFKLNSLQNYFSNKGIISIKKSFQADSWPQVVYPDFMRLQKQIDLLQLKIDSLNEKKLSWRKHVNETNLNELKIFFGKYVDKTYWKHLAKTLSDKDYKQDSDSIKLPVHLIANPKVKPMIEKFVNDSKYRRQLTETVNNSIVYKDKQIGSHHAKSKEFRLSIGQGQLTEIAAQIKELRKEIDVLSGIQKLVARKI